MRLIRIIYKVMDNTVGSLTQEQKSIIIGSILGDGYLRYIELWPHRDLFLFHTEKELIALQSIL